MLGRRLAHGHLACMAARRAAWQHEPAWYAVRDTGFWCGDRKQTTVWAIPSGGQDAQTPHSTQKPVECMRRPILNNSNPGQAVYDPFLCSGTTLIASESTGRVCYGMELEPRFVDVAIRRWQAFTGRFATLVSDERPFEEVAHERQLLTAPRHPFEGDLNTASVAIGADPGKSTPTADNPGDEISCFPRGKDPCDGAGDASAEMRGATTTAPVHLAEPIPSEPGDR